MIREPVVAGTFYPGTADRLQLMLEQLVEKGAEKEDVVGALLPHAGYQYSGGVAGATISRVKFTDTFVIMGPSHTGLGEPFSIMTEGVWKTPLGEVAIDEELGKKILAASRFIKEDYVAHLQEHAVEVQLPFLQYFKPDVRIVPIILAPADVTVYQEIGQAIAGAISEVGREVVIIASGDMTHYEPQKVAEQKDREGIEAMLHLDEMELLKRVREQDISMCAYAPAASMIVAARELGAVEAEHVSYQTSGDTTGDYSAVVGYAGIIIKKGGMSPVAKLAKNVVEKYVREGERLQPQALTPQMEGRAGVFVSIHKNDALRGCIGTFEPVESNIAEEIVSNAISSATRDPRFLPITVDELKNLEYSVDVLTTPEPIASKDELDPERYGVIVEAGWRRGLLLPDLEGVDSVDEQIDICRQKAGIGPSEPVNLYRFEVKRYK
ncbi:MAG: AmmeMemoRadiSam system protein B [Dehalococcoidales bacterium]|nr:MAG: AmmeMemoRadiSam system protein B [Dehalococcoidales bacterium]